MIPSSSSLRLTVSTELVVVIVKTIFGIKSSLNHFKFRFEQQEIFEITPSVPVESEPRAPHDFENFHPHLGLFFSVMRLPLDLSRDINGCTLRIIFHINLHSLVIISTNED